MKDFDFYEITGVIAPGIIVIIGGIILFFPDQRNTLVSIREMSIGGLGVVMVLSYVVGQLLQVIGNGIQDIYWVLWNGMPTDWVRTMKHPLLSPRQHEILQNKIQIMLTDNTFELSAKLRKEDWKSITKQLYALLESAKCHQRVYILNSNYGLSRGISAAFVMLSIGVAFFDFRAWKTEVILIVLFGLSVSRMHHFGVLYGKELFVRFISSGENHER